MPALPDKPPAPLRIGFNEVLVSDRPAGAARREFELLPTLLPLLASRGHTARVYFNRDASPELIERLTGLPPDDPAIVRTPLVREPTWRRLLAGYAWWPRQVRCDRLDALLWPYYPFPRLTTGIILLVHDLRFLDQPETYRPSRLRFLRTVLPYACRRAAAIHVVSEDTATMLRRAWPDCAPRLSVVPNPMGPPPPTTPDTPWLAARGLDTPFLLFVGHMEPRKNLPRVLNAHARLRTAGHHVKLAIVGQELDFGEVARVPDDPSIVRLGRVSEAHLDSLYQAALALVFPSLHEGFGYPILEAMRVGTPVLTSRHSAMAEVAGDAAVLVDPTSTPDLTAALARLLQDPTLRTDLRERGLRRCEAYSPTASAHAFLADLERRFRPREDTVRA